MFDHDDYAKETCDCGHSRHQHNNGNGRCRHTRQVFDHAATVAAYGPDTSDPRSPLDWPANWPKPESCPTKTVSCCTVFRPAGTAAAEEPPDGYFG